MALFACVVPTLLPPCSPTRRMARVSHPVMQKMDGGDLEGGASSERNADVKLLKKLFYKDSKDEEPREAGGAGWLFRNIPLARWQVVLLPHQQVLLNVFQPEYVHMFEVLLAQPRPWHYMHVLLPGGVESLDKPEYALPGLATGGGLRGGSKAQLQGVLMQVVAVQRQKDARLRLVVQGVGRAVALRGTQARHTCTCPSESYLT